MVKGSYVTIHMLGVMGLKKILLCLCIVPFLVGCSIISSINGIKEINVFKVIEMLQDEDVNSFLLYIEAEDCYSCDEYRKVLEELQKESAFRIYVMKVHMDEKNEDVKKALAELRVTTGAIEQLPTTYYFYRGKLLTENKKEGYQEKEELKAWLKNLQIIQ